MTKVTATGNEIAMTVTGERIKRLREAAGMSQGELAEKSGVDPSYISLLETGKRPNPGVETLRRIAPVLGTTLAYLAGETDDPSPTHRVDTVAAWSPHGYDKLTPEQQKEVDEFIAYVRHKYRKGGPYDRHARRDDAD